MWDLIDKLKVNLIYLPYSQAMDSLPHLTHSLPHLKCLGIISGQIAAIYYKEYKDKLPNTHIVYGYGMTEIGFATVQYGDCAVESSGKPVPKDVIFKIVDPDTETALDLNTVGEIRIKNKTAMCGYYKNTTIDVWDNQGFLKTGDLGYFNEKYELFIVDRIKEMFRFNGRHTIPARIERILREHHAVLHATIIGIPINDNDHHAMGIVVLRDGYSVSADELINLVNDRMDVMHQIRAGIQFLADNEIPYTVTGKIDRRKLKQMYSN
ncbi:luciferin 4-monooxygenase-like [Atheta coriaria]